MEALEILEVRFRPSDQRVVIDVQVIGGFLDGRVEQLATTRDALQSRASVGQGVFDDAVLQAEVAALAQARHAPPALVVRNAPPRGGAPAEGQRVVVPGETPAPGVPMAAVVPEIDPGSVAPARGNPEAARGT